MKKLPLVFVLVIAGLLWLVFDLYRDAGELRDLRPHFSGSISRVDGPVGAEDITIDQETGIAYISSDDRRVWFASTPKGPSGNLFAYDLKAPGAEPVNLTPGLPFEFHPHGISLVRTAQGGRRLFAVNHRAAGDFIEIFDLAGLTAQHVTSVHDPLARSVNDVLAVDEQRFYLTIDHGNTSKPGRKLEEYLRLSRSFVLYYDGTAFRRVAGGLLYANGINMSADGSRLYVASTTAHKVVVYARELTTGALQKETEIDCGAGVDNIDVATHGDLWVAGHPHLLTFVKYAGDSTRVSPSEVIKIHPTEGGVYEVQSIFLDSGARFSGSSVAAVFGDKLLIGSVFDRGFLVCTLPHN